MDQGMYCKQCGYFLKALDANQCPECGRHFSADDPFSFRPAPFANEFLHKYRRWLPCVGCVTCPACDHRLSSFRERTTVRTKPTACPECGRLICYPKWAIRFVKATGIVWSIGFVPVIGLAIYLDSQMLFFPLMGVGVAFFIAMAWCMKLTEYRSVERMP